MKVDIILVKKFMLGQIKTRILRFSAYTLPIFREYRAWAAFWGTMWVVLVPTTIHIPTQVPNSQKKKKINLKKKKNWNPEFFFFMAQKFGLPNKFGKVASLCSTCANHYPHTKFHQCIVNTELLMFAFFLLLANQNKYANELFNMRIRWWQTTWVTLVPTTTHIPLPSCMKIGHCLLPKVYLFVISQSEQICKWAI